MVSPVQFEAGVIEDALAQVDQIRDWPGSFSQAEVNVARADLRRRLSRFVDGLIAGDPIAMGVVQVLEERPNIALITLDRSSPVQAVAIAVKVQGLLVVIKIWMHPSYSNVRGQSHAKRDDPAQGQPRGKNGL